MIIHAADTQQHNEKLDTDAKALLNKLKIYCGYGLSLAQEAHANKSNCNDILTTIEECKLAGIYNFYPPQQKIIQTLGEDKYSQLKEAFRTGIINGSLAPKERRNKQRQFAKHKLGKTALLKHTKNRWWSRLQKAALLLNLLCIGLLVYIAAQPQWIIAATLIALIVSLSLISRKDSPKISKTAKKTNRNQSYD